MSGVRVVAIVPSLIVATARDLNRVIDRSHPWDGLIAPAGQRRNGRNVVAPLAEEDIGHHPVERAQVQYGRTRIEYGIRRSAKRTTVAVTVDAVKGVMITAPTGVEVERLDRIVKDKAEWIVNRLRLVADAEPPSNIKEFISGESFAYLGRNYRLRVVDGDVMQAARLEAGWLVVGVDAALRGPARSNAIEAAIQEWYTTRAVARLEERARVWAASAGVEVADVRVKDQHKRWGSCDGKGVLRFNWRIIQAPMRLVDYVVAHEVVHLVHRDHTKAFWGRLGVIMPDYERRKEELRRLGGRLSW